MWFLPRTLWEGAEFGFAIMRAEKNSPLASLRIRYVLLCFQDMTGVQGVKQHRVLILNPWLLLSELKILCPAVVTLPFEDICITQLLQSVLPCFTALPRPRGVLWGIHTLRDVHSLSSMNSAHHLHTAPAIHFLKDSLASQAVLSPKYCWAAHARALFSPRDPAEPFTSSAPCSPNATAWTPLRHQEQTDPYRSPTRDQQMCCWMVLAACLAGAKTSDSRNSFGQGWNEGCLVGNNEPIAPSGESAGQLPWQGIKTWRRKKNTTKTNQKALSWLTPTASTYRACFQNRRNEFVVQRIKTGIQSLPIQKLQTAIKHNRLHKAAAQPPMSGQCHQTFPQHFLFPYVHIYIYNTHIYLAVLDLYLKRNFWAPGIQESVGEREGLWKGNRGTAVNASLIVIWCTDVNSSFRMVM